MTWSYWADSGKPTLNNELPTSQTGKVFFYKSLGI